MSTKRLSGNERRMTVLRSGVLAGVWAAALAAGAGDVYTNSASGNWSAAASWNGAMPAAGGAAAFGFKRPAYLRTFFHE